MTYSLQRYQGGNFAALQAVPDGHRKVASLAASHEFDLTPRCAVGYGARYEHYDYLERLRAGQPDGEAVVRAGVRRCALHAKASMQQVAPGAEEFVPPADAHWVPPQRTFAPLGLNRFSHRTRAEHYEVGATRQFRGLSVGVRASARTIDDQLVTVFGAADPARLIAAGGHYGVASAGDAAMQGWAIGCAHELSPHVRGRDRLHARRRPTGRRQPAPTAPALAAAAPRALRQPHERLHDVTSSLEAEVPRSDTRFVRALQASIPDSPAIPGRLQTADGRFDMQLRQGLPFMNGGQGRLGDAGRRAQPVPRLDRRPFDSTTSCSSCQGAEAGHRRAPGPLLIRRASPESAAPEFWLPRVQLAWNLQTVMFPAIC